MHVLITSLAIAVALGIGEARAYGGGGSSSSCSEPKFFEPNPTGVVTSLTEFNAIASDATDPSTLTVEIGSEQLQPTVTPRGNGEWLVKAIPAQPLSQPGKVRIALKAKSRDGCWGFQPYFIEIKP